MILLIVKGKDEYSKEFVLNLKTIFKNRFLLLAKPEKIKVIENKIKLKYNLQKLDLYNICINSIENSLIIENNDDYTININPNSRINNLKVDSIIKYINEGDLDTPPYPIFTEVRQYIEKNITKFQTLYQMGIIV